MNALTDTVIGAAIQIHSALDPGLLESAYEACVAFELSERKLRFERQKPLPVRYRGVELDCAYWLDLLVEDAIIIEIKAVQTIEPVHHAQLLSYLKLAQKPVGLIINFHVPMLRQVPAESSTIAEPLSLLFWSPRTLRLISLGYPSGVLL